METSNGERQHKSGLTLVMESTHSLFLEPSPMTLLILRSKATWVIQGYMHIELMVSCSRPNSNDLQLQCRTTRNNWTNVFLTTANCVYIDMVMCIMHTGVL